MKSSRWPARLDRWQSISGLVLALFIWVHLLGDSSILLGDEAFRAVGHFWEGSLLFGQPQPWLTSLAGAAIFALIAVHALLAMRKFPSDYRSYRAMSEHSRAMGHGDTRLWWVQVWTGFAMFFLAPVHLYVVMAMPEDVGPVLSSQRVVWDMFWPLYALLLLAVVPHAAIGLYRLAMKWGWPTFTLEDKGRRRARWSMWLVTGVFLVMGFLALGRFIQIGLDSPRAATSEHAAQHASAHGDLQ